MPNGETPGDPVFDFEMYAMPQSGAPATPSSALITPGSTWHYWDYPVGHANDDLASRRWTLSGFDMGGIWKSGTAPLGYGTGEEATVINRFQDPGGDTLTTIPSALFRRGFDVPDPTAITTLHLYLRRDDGAAVYLNGERILLDNLAPHDNLPTASALSPATVETRSQWHHSTVSARRLRAGRNYIAVSVHQHAMTESILAFDLQLIGQMTAEPELSLKMEGGPGGGPPEITWSAAHIGWSVEHSTDLRNWVPYTVPPMVDGPKLRLWLTNPGERGFFRLVSPVNLGGAR